MPADPPSPFIVEWAATLKDGIPAHRRALDLAMGRGRHACALALLGYRVFGVDLNGEAVDEARRRAAACGAAVRAWRADLTVYPLPRERFELLVVARYLQRDLFPMLRAALVTGGALLYETFTEAQRSLGRGPKSPDHLLRSGELASHLRGFDILFEQEVMEKDALARVVALKTGR